MKKQVSIYLPSKIDAFCLNKNQLNKVAMLFPEVEFINCENQNQYINELENSFITLTWKFKEEWYEKSPNLNYIFTPAAGHDWIAEDPKKNVSINHSTFHGKLMGESLLGMILYMNRNYGTLVKMQQEKVWNRNIQSTLSPLTKQTILIAGFGNIAKEFCKMIQPFNCKIIGLQRTYSDIIDQPSGAQLIKSDTLNEWLPKADHVIAILPSGKSTDNFFTEDHFKRMKRSAFFYNIGRGNCCDDDVINNAVNSEEIAGAALDVFNREPLPKDSSLWYNSKIFLSPHSSAIFENYLDLFIDEIEPLLKTIL